MKLFLFVLYLLIGTGLNATDGTILTQTTRTWIPRRNLGFLSRTKQILDNVPNPYLQEEPQESQSRERSRSQSSDRNYSPPVPYTGPPILTEYGKQLENYNNCVKEKLARNAIYCDLLKQGMSRRAARRELKRLVKSGDWQKKQAPSPPPVTPTASPQMQQEYLLEKADLPKQLTHFVSLDPAHQDRLLYRGSNEQQLAQHTQARQTLTELVGEWQGNQDCPQVEELVSMGVAMNMAAMEQLHVAADFAAELTIAAGQQALGLLRGAKRAAVDAGVGIGTRSSVIHSIPRMASVILQ